MAINRFLYQGIQRGFATCSGTDYLIDTCSASAVYGKWQLALADVPLDK
jgi:hypothetical protein